MSRQRRSRSSLLWPALIVTVAVGGFGAYRFFAVETGKPSYLFAAVEHGDIALQVAGSGTA